MAARLHNMGLIVISAPYVMVDALHLQFEILLRDNPPVDIHSVASPRNTWWWLPDVGLTSRSITNRYIEVAPLPQWLASVSWEMNRLKNEWEYGKQYTCSHPDTIASGILNADSVAPTSHVEDAESTVYKESQQKIVDEIINE